MPGSQKGGPPPEDAGPPPESAFSEGGLEYAVVVACRCSHTGEGSGRRIESEAASRLRCTCAESGSFDNLLKGACHEMKMCRLFVVVL